MHNQLHELISNPNYLSSSEIYVKLSDKKYCDELSSILGEDVVEKLRTCKDNIIQLKTIKTTSVPERSEEYTHIYVWGCRKSGKTSLLGALFAAMQDQCKSLKWTVDSDTADRISTLIKFFSNKNTSFCKLKDSKSAFQMYNVECIPKGTFENTSYPLTFIEADVLDVTRNPQLTQQLQSTQNKIHFFCFDCSASRSNQQTQVYLFCELLKQLRDTLKTSIGIYLIVTKVDTMLHVPEEFRHNAAQTFITANHGQLWQQIVNACYEMNIYDSTPIPFSIGNVVLKDIVEPNLKDAIGLLHYPIFLKASRRPGILKKFLWSGGWKRTLLGLILFFCIFAYALYAAFSIVSTPPLVKPKAYHFESDFINRVKTEIEDHDFETSRKSYDNLRWELIVENRIRLSDAKKLKDVTFKCDSILTNAFAKVLISRYSSLYNKEDWHNHSNVFKDLGDYVIILDRKPIVARTLLNSYEDNLKRMWQFHIRLDTLVNMIDLANKCTSWSDVEYITKNYSSYQRFPYENDKTLSTSLSCIVEKSHNSYSEHLYKKAKDFRNNYNGQIKWGENNDQSPDYFIFVRRKFVTDTRKLRHEIKIAKDKSPEEYKYKYKKAEKKLSI